MKINIQGKEVAIKFYHNNHALPKGEKLPKEGFEYERGTTCIIFDVKGDEISSGSANVHPRDNFSKETGRKISLTRAIKNFNAEARTQIWNEYRNWGKNRW